jgi:hypothetical protein
MKVSAIARPLSTALNVGGLMIGCSGGSGGGFPPTQHRKPERSVKTLDILESDFVQPGQLVRDICTLIMVHTLYGCVNLGGRAAERACAVKMDCLNQFLHAFALAGDLLGVDEYAPRGQGIQDAAVKIAFSGVVQVMYGQRRDNGIKGAFRQGIAQRSNGDQGVSFFKAAYSLVQHVG